MGTRLVSELERLAGSLAYDGHPAGEGVFAGGGGKNRERTACKRGRGGHSGSLESMETPAFFGATRVEECGIHSADEHFGAGRANGTGEPAGNQQQVFGGAARERL